MRQKRLKLSAVLLLSLGLTGLTGLQAQEAITATGGNALGSGGSASYSVGQVVYTTNIGTNGYSIAEGVQQPYEISVVNGIEQAKGINLECLAYPNPTTDFLTLKVDASTYFDNAHYKSLSIPSMEYLLYDMKGKFLKNKKLTSNKTIITMENFVVGTYFLKVVQTNHDSSKQELKTFKIIKN
ncbi:MAG: T9SS type A sorting domain-containing protein [Bacteroidales bacterium]|nr:T9SS type A sorting domain-containing protein [Bacteroidales bacterium]